jgi:hypothetical protein
MPVPAASPSSLASVVLMSTKPGSMRAATAAVVPEAVEALPDGEAVELPPLPARPRPAKPLPKPGVALELNDDGAEELPGQVKCVITALAEAAMTAITSAATTGRCHGSRGGTPGGDDGGAGVGAPDGDSGTDIVYPTERREAHAARSHGDQLACRQIFDHGWVHCGRHIQRLGA